MKIIAFDLGRNFAYAHNLEEPFKAVSFLLEGDSRAHRLGFLNTTLTNLFASFYTYRVQTLDIVVYESPFARGRDATRSLWGIAGIIEACATNAGLPVVDVAVPTIKKFASGFGKSSKLGMLAAARKFGYKGRNEHEADAVCLLKYAEANLERATEK